MSRRSSRPRRSVLRGLLPLAVLIGVLYLYWRYPDAFSWLQPSDGPVIRVDLSTSAAQPTLAPAAQPTQPPAATPLPTTAVSAPAGGQGSSAAVYSQSGGWYQLFFSNPRYPDRREYHRDGIDAHLAALLDTATATIDIAIYDFDLENVANALARAAGRGVRVRMVTDSDTLTNDDAAVQRAFAIVKGARIPIVDDGRPAIMHNKFVVVDAATVWTGSWNFTDGDTYRLNNNAIQIASAELAQNYTAEFEKMFVQRQFGPAKAGSLRDPVLSIGGVRVENYFAPEDGVAARINSRLQQAKQSIHFLAFSFTSDPIGKTVRQKAKEGVQVAGVFETTGSETLYSEYGKMLKAKLDVLQDGNPYVMHHKVIIIDGKTVIFGSYNFTNNAENDNDENLLIVDDAQLASAFEAEFQRVRATALKPPK